MPKPWENAEGYPDFTAYHGINNVMRQEQEAKRVSAVIGTLKGVAALAGFEIDGRITLIDKITGRKHR